MVEEDVWMDAVEEAEYEQRKTADNWSICDSEKRELQAP